MRTMLGLALACVVACGVLFFLRIRTAREPLVPLPSGSVVMRTNVSSPAAIQASLTEPLPPEAPSAKPELAIGPAPAASSQKPLQQKPITTVPKKGKDPIKDTLAREALALVGYDEQAEAYWVGAINDPGLSSQERQDLIEDLNEDGISDPKLPTISDLPLILSRLELIELLAPQSMDQVNADAFMEAYKDLLNLADVALGGGEPIR